MKFNWKIVIAVCACVFMVAPNTFSATYSAPDYTNEELKKVSQEFGIVLSEAAAYEMDKTDIYNPNMSKVCSNKKIKNYLKNLKKEFKIVGTCRSGKISLAFSFSSTQTGSINNCVDTSHYYGIGKPKLKNGIAYCDYKGVDFKKLKEYYVEYYAESYSNSSSETAQRKSKEAMIKSELSNLRAQAELYYDSHSGTKGFGEYYGYCNDKSVTVANTKVKTSNQTGLTCTDNRTSYSIEAPLVFEKGKYYCVDSNGTAVVTSKRMKSIEGKYICIQSN